MHLKKENKNTARNIAKNKMFFYIAIFSFYHNQKIALLIFI